MSNNNIYYRGPVKEAYRICCDKCGKDVDSRWNYCPACGAAIVQSDNKPFSSNSVTDPQSGQ